jgi:hypothetical protein
MVFTFFGQGRRPAPSRPPAGPPRLPRAGIPESVQCTTYYTSRRLHPAPRWHRDVRSVTSQRLLTVGVVTLVTWHAPRMQHKKWVLRGSAVRIGGLKNQLNYDTPCLQSIHVCVCMDVLDHAVLFRENDLHDIQHHAGPANESEAETISIQRRSPFSPRRARLKFSDRLRLQTALGAQLGRGVGTGMELVE